MVVVDFGWLPLYKHSYKYNDDDSTFIATKKRVESNKIQTYIKEERLLK